MDKFFWLICGAWFGFGGATIIWQSLRKHIASGKLDENEVKSFIKGFALWAFIPSLVLWLLQLSIKGDSTPMYFNWPTTQKYMAFCLQLFIWLALIYWVFFNDGAKTLAKFSSTTNVFSNFFSPLLFKVLAIIVVLNGLFAFFSNNA